MFDFANQFVQFRKSKVEDSDNDSEENALLVTASQRTPISPQKGSQKAAFMAAAAAAAENVTPKKSSRAKKAKVTPAKASTTAKVKAPTKKKTTEKKPRECLGKYSTTILLLVSTG